MNFDFDADQKALQSEVRRFLDDRAKPEKVREVLDGRAAYQADLWRELGTMGYTGAAVDEAFGGSGLGYLELCLIAEELGRTLAAVPFSSTVYLAAELIKSAGSQAQRERWLPRIARAQTIACIASAEGAGREEGNAPIGARVAKGLLSGVKEPIVDGDIADFAIVLALDQACDESPSLFIVELSSKCSARRRLKSIDPTRGMGRLEFSEAPAERLGSVGQGMQLLQAAYDRAAVLIAFEQLGGAERTVLMARDYSLQRYAFGRPIGSFQAIKHLIADMYTSTVLARSNAYHGAWALSTDSAELPLAAAYARVSATRAYQFCAANNIQVHGGMGFTWESDCHLFYRRASLLALQCGTLSEWERKVVRRLDAAGGPKTFKQS